MTTLYQCRLRQGATETIAWIEARGARKGVRVELRSKGFDSGLWSVIDVFNSPLAAEVLRQKQAMDRNALASVRDWKRAN